MVFCGDLIEESADPAADEGSGSCRIAGDRGPPVGTGQPRGLCAGPRAVVDAGFLAEQRDWLRRSATRH